MLADHSLCSGCSACAVSCPKSCIQMVPDEKGFLYPQINASKCVNCHLCQKICPVGSPLNATDNQTTAYAAHSTNNAVRYQSSSGGVFSLLAEEVINNGGVVFGACFDEAWNVIHSYAEDLGGLSKFRGSKYVQSQIGDSYFQVKCFLKSGRSVLFSGTPCQIGGLKAYLSKEYSNLICIDMVCHGVPSSLIWKKYCIELSKRYQSKVKSITFRDKMFGWKSYCLRVRFDNGKTYLLPPSLDPYMRMFLANFTLRESCFNCQFKSVDRQADITIADFWGIDRVCPELDDNTGVSLMLVHSSVGEALTSSLGVSLEKEEVVPDLALQFNPAAIQSVLCPDQYEQFWRDVPAHSLGWLAKRYCRIPYILHMKMKLHFLLKKHHLIK